MSSLAATTSWFLLVSMFYNVAADKHPGVCLLQQGSSRIGIGSISSHTKSNSTKSNPTGSKSLIGKTALDEPGFNPERWNKNQAVLRSHNCYEYSLNDFDPIAVNNCEEKLKKNSKDKKQCRRWFHIPGYRYHQDNLHEAVRFNHSAITCEHMLTRVAEDGKGALLWSGPDKQPTTEYGPKAGRSWNHNDHCPGGSYMASLVLQPGKRFHFYRRDHGCLDPENQGKRCWSHKPGILEATRFDAKGKEIFNLHKADRSYGKHSYTDVCGFYCVPSNRKATTHSDFYRGAKDNFRWAVV